MKKLNKNKWMIVLFMIVTVCGLTGCQEAIGGRTSSAPNKDVIYDWTDIWLDGVKGYATIQAISEDNFYIMANEMWEENDPASENSSKINRISRMYICDRDWENMREIPLNLSQKESGEEFLWGYRMCAVDDFGNISFEIANRELEDFELVKTDAAGNELARRSVSEICGEEGYLDYMIADRKGNLIVAGHERVAVLDENLELGGYLFLNDARVTGLALGKDGQIFCSMMSDLGTEMVRTLNIDKMELESTYRMKRHTNIFAVMNGSGQYDFYYQNDEGVFGYLIKDKKGAKLMDYAASGVAENRQGYFFPLEDGRILGCTEDVKEDVLGVAIYSKADPDSDAGNLE